MNTEEILNKFSNEEISIDTTKLRTIDLKSTYYRSMDEVGVWNFFISSMNYAFKNDAIYVFEEWVIEDETHTTLYQKVFAFGHVYTVELDKISKLELLLILLGEALMKLDKEPDNIDTSLTPRPVCTMRGDA